MLTYELTSLKLTTGFRLNMAEATICVHEGTCATFKACLSPDADSVLLAAVKAVLTICGNLGMLHIQSHLGQIQAIQIQEAGRLVFEKQISNGDLHSKGIAREAAINLVAALNAQTTVAAPEEAPLATK